MLNPWQNNQLIGHCKQKEIILNAINNQRFSNSWLFSGSKGIGKSTFAFQIAKMLFSDQHDLQYDQNTISTKKVDELEHLDLIYITPNNEQKKTSSDIITIDEIRKLQDFIRSTPTESKYKIVIIDPIDNLNKNAANALLKILEEPPLYVVFFLINHKVGKIMDTIKSRCQVLDFIDNTDIEIDQLIDLFLNEITNDDKNNYKIFKKNSFGWLTQAYQQKLYDQYIDFIEKISTITAGKQNLNIEFFYQILKYAEDKQSEVIYLINTMIYRHNLYLIDEGNTVSEAEILLFKQLDQKDSPDSYIDWLSNMNESFNSSDILNLDSRVNLWDNLMELSK